MLKTLGALGHANDLDLQRGKRSGRKASDTGFRFIDLCAGIGGMRLAAEAHGGRCVFSAEIDKEAQATYEANHGDKPHGDITKIAPDSVPEHDLLIGGFPCQPFSICGLKRGFEDTRGTLFFHILEVAKAKSPHCILLENVKHFADHDSGRTMEVILAALRELGYTVAVRVINAKDFGVPQNRERTIIVASMSGEFDFDLLPRSTPLTVNDIIEKGVEYEFINEPYTLLPDDITKLQPGSGLKFVGYRNRKLRQVGVRDGTEHLSRVHKQPNRIYSADGTHPTLAAGETSGRYWILHEGKVRKLTMRECYRLQGFPESFRIHANPTSAYRQIGNSVPVPMITVVVEQIVKQGLMKPCALSVAA